MVPTLACPVRDPPALTLLSADEQLGFDNRCATHPRFGLRANNPLHYTIHIHRWCNSALTRQSINERTKPSPTKKKILPRARACCAPTCPAQQVAFDVVFSFVYSTFCSLFSPMNLSPTFDDLCYVVPHHIASVCERKKKLSVRGTRSTLA